MKEWFILRLKLVAYILQNVVIAPVMK